MKHVGCNLLPCVPTSVLGICRIVDMNFDSSPTLLFCLGLRHVHLFARMFLLVAVDSRARNRTRPALALRAVGCVLARSAREEFLLLNPGRVVVCFLGVAVENFLRFARALRGVLDAALAEIAR